MKAKAAWPTRIYNRRLGLIYKKDGADVYYPDFGEEIDSQEEQPIGIYGQMRLRYLREHRRATYASLLTSGELATDLRLTDNEVQDFVSRWVDAKKKADGVDEILKADDQIAWVGLMNNIIADAREAALSEIVYA